ncbi:RNA polymerase factor sigma-32 [Actinobacillus equuli]|nr:RNA polymerase factor sigma-32 [Actinobacillus equuli]
MLENEPSEAMHPALVQGGMPVPQGNLDSYIRMANQYPILSAEQEKSWRNVIIMMKI